MQLVFTATELASCITHKSNKNMFLLYVLIKKVCDIIHTSLLLYTEIQNYIKKKKKNV